MSALRLACTLVGSLWVTAAAVDVGPSAGVSGRGELFNDWRGRLESAHQASVQGEYDQAIQLYGSILSDAEARGEEGLLVARAADGLADLHRERHQFDVAAPLYERSVRLWTSLLGKSQPRRAVSLHNLGICYVELNDWSAAERVLREALTVWRDTHAPQARTRETEKVLDAAIHRHSIPWKTTTR